MCIMGLIDGESIYGSSGTPYSDAVNYIMKGVNAINYDVGQPYGMSNSSDAKPDNVIDMQDFYKPIKNRLLERILSN